MARRVLAFFLVFCMAAGEWPVRAAGIAALGVVTQASGANLSNARISTGASVYDGDSFSTSSAGILRVRAGAAQVYLASQSGFTLHAAQGGTIAQLSSGTLVFSSAKANAMEIEAVKARIRPAADGPTVAQIGVVGPRTLEVRARRGNLQFSYNGETELIPEGSAFRVVLDPTEEESVAATAVPAFQGQQVPRKSSRRRKGFLFFIIGVVAISTGIAVDEALESPTRP